MQAHPWARQGQRQEGPCRPRCMPWGLPEHPRQRSASAAFWEGHVEQGGRRDPEREAGPRPGGRRRGGKNETSSEDTLEREARKRRRAAPGAGHMGGVRGCRASFPDLKETWGRWVGGDGEL